MNITRNLVEATGSLTFKKNPTVIITCGCLWLDTSMETKKSFLLNL
jgi:hypothetical protein